MALMGALVDSFRAPTLNTALWNVVNSVGNSGQQAGDRYTFIVKAGATGDASLISDATYDLTGSHLHVELIDAGVQEAGLETYPIILSVAPGDLDDCLLIVVSNGLVGLYEFAGGVPNLLATPAYNAITMRWFRISEDGGVVAYEAAPAVRGPWTTLATVNPAIPINALHVQIRTFCFLSLTTAKQAAISNVNYLSPPGLPFPNGVLDAVVEAAFGADLTADQSTWEWTDLTPEADDLLTDQTINTTRGRQNESSDVDPTQSGMRLDNPTGDLTPGNAMGAYYPYVRLGTPARWGVEYGDPRLWLPPAYTASAVVASTSALDITADLDVRVDLHLRTHDPDGWNAVLAGRADNAGQYSWRLEARPGGVVTLLWSDDGTPPASEATSTMPVLPASSRTVLRVTLDVDNGAGGNTTVFWLGDSITGPWTQIGDPVVGAGTTAVFDANEPLIVGSPPDVSVDFAPDADVYRFQLRDGINGTVIADADFGQQQSGVMAFVDSTGLLWTITGPGMLTSRWYRAVGSWDSIRPLWPWGDLSAQQPGGLGVGQARTDVTFSGLLRRLGQGADPLDSPLRRSIVDEPTLQGYWPLEDGKDSTQIASGLADGAPGVVVGEVTMANNDDLVGSRPLPTLSTTGGFNAPITGVFAGRWQVDWYVQIPTAPGSPRGIMRVTTTGTVTTWVVDVSAGALTVTGLGATGAVVTTESALPVGLYVGWHHMRLEVIQDGSDVDYVMTWFPVTYPPSTGFTFGDTFAGSVGVPIAWATPPDVLLDGLSMGHVAILAGTGIDTSGQAATGWQGETAVARMRRLCAEEQIYFRIIGASADTVQVGTQRTETLLDLLDDAAQADGGILYELPYAVGLCYRTRASLYNQAPNMILDALNEELQNPFSPTLDDQRLRNDVTVSRDGGSSVQLVDQGSVDESGRYTESVTLNLFSDTQLQDAAGWRLHQGTIPGMRYPSVSSRFGPAPQVIPQWLTCDVGSRILVINLPPQHPTTEVEVMMQGYTESVSPVTWDMDANCSPAGVWDVAMLDGVGVPDEYLLRLETDGSELTLDVTDTATTLVVTVLAGPAWVSDPAEFPFDIAIGGERITVTAIAAPAGSSEFVGGGSASTSTTTSFVAPSVVASAAGDLLICCWSSFDFNGTYTLPGGMTIAALTSGTYSSVEDATQVLGAPGATGTRTATFSTNDAWSAISVVVHGALGTPTVVEYLDAVTTGAPADPITLTTLLDGEQGDWLLAIQAWDWDPGDNMAAPSGVGWVAVADSMLASNSTSRIRAWARRVTAVGPQAATFGTVGGINDNHARLYLLRGATGQTQTFTVTRSVNGVVKPHVAGAGVELWFAPVLAR